MTFLQRVLAKPDETVVGGLMFHRVIVGVEAPNVIPINLRKQPDFARLNKPSANGWDH
jgi:hypothetical protein